MNLFDKYKDYQTTEVEGLGRGYGTAENPWQYVGVTTVLHEVLRNKYENKDTTNRDKAADEGSTVHTLFAESLTGGSPEIPEKYLGVIQAFNQWVSVKKVKPLFSEVKAVSEQYGFAGQIDFIGEVNGKVTVVDWKTGFEYDNKWGLQVAAYHLLVCEIMQIAPKDLNFGILHIPLRSPKSFKWLPFQHYDWLQRGFLACLELYKHQPRFTQLKKMNWPYLFKPAIEGAKRG